MGDYFQHDTAIVDAGAQVGKGCRICLFVYDFPHRKSIDFMSYLVTKGYEVSLVVGAPFKKLKVKRGSVRIKVKAECYIQPSEMAHSYSIPYVSADHDCCDLSNIVKQHKCDLGVIAGARILKSPIIEAFELGIMNFHPGLLPEIRGLDAVLWSLKKNVNFGVTSHIIDNRVDAGHVLLKKQVGIERDDTIFDISEKLYSCQFLMFEESFRKAMAREYQVCDFKSRGHQSIDYEESIKIVHEFERRSYPCDL
jgi:folate-dependent phosphoribosylglycinamide formyltransferase PurN